MPLPGTLETHPGGPGAYTLRVPPGHPAFEGHFPGAPILSGLIQIDWALALGRTAFPLDGTFRALERLKFQAPIRPDEPVTLHLAWDAAQGLLAFRYEGEAGRKSSGLARFAPTP